MKRDGIKRGRWLVFYALALWGQLVFSLGMTCWRDSLILFYDWKPYPSFVPREFDGFIDLATQSSPPNSRVAYLSPTGDIYTSRFARLSYFLYPREVLWLGTGPRTSATSRWVEVDMMDSSWVQILRDQRIQYILLDDIPKSIPLLGDRVPFDSARYILTLSK